MKDTETLNDNTSEPKKKRSEPEEKEGDLGEESKAIDEEGSEKGGASPPKSPEHKGEVEEERKNEDLSTVNQEKSDEKEKLNDIQNSEEVVNNKDVEAQASVIEPDDQQENIVENTLKTYKEDSSSSKMTNEVKVPESKKSEDVLEDEIVEEARKSSGKRKRSSSSPEEIKHEESLKETKKHSKSHKEKPLSDLSEKCQEADLEILEKMKEKLEKELDSEERLEKHSRSKKHKRTHEEPDQEAGKRAEKRDNSSKKDSSESHLWRSENNASVSPTMRDSPSPPQKSRQTKTSDTYWNKYADKLGIKIDDPHDKESETSTKKYPDSPRERSSRYKPDTENVKEKRREKSEEAKLEKENVVPLIKKPVLDPLSMKSGGAYIPPARLKMMQDAISDKSSPEFQRLAWEALKKSIVGLVNKVNVSNIGIIVKELFKENIVRGRGVLVRALMQAQAFSPTFTHVYAALVAVINSKFPQIGELLLHRLVIQFRRGVKRNDKSFCMASCKFLAHLINQQVAHEVVALEILTMLLERAKDITDNSDTGEKSRQASVELAIAFLKECGMKLSELTPKGLMIIMETLRNILHEGKLDPRFKYMIEVLMAIKKENFKDFPAIIDKLDLVEEEDQFTHIVELDGKLNGEEMLNVFKVDPSYEENEGKYKELKESILGDSDDDDENDSGSEGDDEESDSDEEQDSGEEKEKNEEEKPILDRTETNLVAFRRTVYLTIQSSLDVDECSHKLLKGEIKPGWEEELCNMIIDCCAQQRTYMKFYGLLAQRFCMINRIYQEPFETIFKDAYETCHRLEMDKLRNVAKLFAHLLFSDAISWEVLVCVRLNQDETTSSSRVFLKILFEVSISGKFLGVWLVRQYSSELY